MWLPVSRPRCLSLGNLQRCASMEPVILLHTLKKESILASSVSKHYKISQQGEEPCILVGCDLPSPATGAAFQRPLHSHSPLLLMECIPGQSAFWRGCGMLSRWAVHYASMLLAYTSAALPATGSCWCAHLHVLRRLTLSCQISDRGFCSVCQIFLKENIPHFLSSDPCTT